MRRILFSAVPAKMACSSLGYSAVYSANRPCEHSWLPSGRGGQVPVAVESGSNMWTFDVIFVSAAWELEIPLLVKSLRDSGIEPFAAERPVGQPFVIGGGPLTLANPDLLAAVCDAVFVGEADEAFDDINIALAAAGGRNDALERLALIPGMWVPSSGKPCPEAVFISSLKVPLVSAFPDEENEFSRSFVVEVGRGCPRGCLFCAAFGGRRGRFYPASAVLDAVPEGTKRAGLLGAAVSDHPKLKKIVSVLGERGVGVTLGSLRADRVDVELVSMLASGGLKTLTVAADGASESLRHSIRKGVTAAHLENVADVAFRTGISRVRVYVMVGLPDETIKDLQEFADLIGSMASRAGMVVSVSPFVPKRFTSLQDAPFAGVPVLRRKISVLKKMLGGRVEIRAGSVRDAEIDYRLSQVRLSDAAEMLSRYAGLR